MLYIYFQRIRLDEVVRGMGGFMVESEEEEEDEEEEEAGFEEEEEEKVVFSEENFHHSTPKIHVAICAIFFHNKGMDMIINTPK